MGRTARDTRPHMKKPERIEVDEKHVTLRVILFLAALAIAVAAFLSAMQFFRTENNIWIRIQPEGSIENSCAGELHFTWQNTNPVITRAVTARYAELCETAAALFDAAQPHEGTANLHTLSAYPNQPVVLSPVLYGALETITTSGTRVPYLAPLYTDCRNLLQAENDADAAMFDPQRDPELMQSLQEVLPYCQDPAHVSLELLPDNTATLHVSDAYLAYAAEAGIPCFYDLYWLRNACIVDYIADTLIAEGYTSGAISSYDGYTRRLDTTGVDFSVNLFDAADGKVYAQGTMLYSKPAALVFLHTFSLSDIEATDRHVYADGTTATPFLSPEDGLPHAALSSLLLFSEENTSCTSLLLQALPVWLTDTFQPEALSSCGTVWFENGEMQSNVPVRVTGK